MTLRYAYVSYRRTRSRGFLPVGPGTVAGDGRNTHGHLLSVQNNGLKTVILSYITYGMPSDRDATLPLPTLPMLHKLGADLRDARRRRRIPNGADG